MVTISWAITVKDEIQEIRYLLSVLDGKIGPDDEIVVLFDEENGSQSVLSYLNEVSEEYGIHFYTGRFKGHFGDWKNKLTSLCTKQYVFQLDSDEYPHEVLLENVHDLIEQNENVDVILVPRVNTVVGITEEHIQKWNWRVTKLESPGLIEEKEIDIDSEEYRLLKNGGFIIEETVLG